MNMNWLEKAWRSKFLLLLSVIALGSAAVYAGGQDATQATSGAQAAQPAVDVKDDESIQGPVWGSGAPIPVPAGLAQTTAAGCGDGRVILIGGGVGGALDPTNAVRAYDPATDEWSDLEPIPVEPGNRAFGSAVYLDGKIYVFGGFDGAMILSSLWIYDCTENTWSSGADMPGERFGPAVAAVGGLIYVMGGFGLAGENNNTWGYDPLTDTFDTALTNMPIPLGRIHGVGFEPSKGGDGEAGRVHIFAGGFGGTNHRIYNIAANAWSIGPPMPFGVTDPATVTDGTNIYLAGGGGPAPRGPGRLQIFDPSAGTWSQGPLMPAPGVDNTSGALVDGTIYVVGGFDGVTAVSTNYAFALPGGQVR